MNIRRKFLMYIKQTAPKGEGFKPYIESYNQRRGA